MRASLDSSALAFLGTGQATLAVLEQQRGVRRAPAWRGSGPWPWLGFSKRSSCIRAPAFKMSPWPSEQCESVSGMARLI